MARAIGDRQTRFGFSLTRNVYRVETSQGSGVNEPSGWYPTCRLAYIFVSAHARGYLATPSAA